MNESSKIEMVIASKPRDLGGFTVRRVLPYASHRMVGPFIFFDHMGPALLKSGEGMDVRPHPHINLATVTYLFDGKIRHRDSLGSDQLIEPGAVNWMTAGRGIVHSERTPSDERNSESNMDGIQLWVALPTEHEETEPSFSHHPKETLPDLNINGVKIKILLGNVFGKASPVPIHSELFYAEIKMPAGSSLILEAERRETAIYVVAGNLNVEGQIARSTEMVIGKRGEDLMITATEETHAMVLGGMPVGERFIYWNFVSSSRERIEEAKKQWASGPRPGHPRFAVIPGDNHDFIPLPEEPGSSKGTIL